MLLLRFLPASSLLLFTMVAAGQGFAPGSVSGTASGFARSSAPASSSEAAPAPPKPLHSFDLSSIDRTADPCTNFYQYACGNWKKNNPIPADEASWVNFVILNERNQYLLYKELEDAATHPKTDLQKQYGTYFSACMDTDAINARGAKPLAPSLDAIAALQDKKEIAALIGDTRYSVGGFANFGDEVDQKDATHYIAAVSQGGLTLPDRDYYLSDDTTMREVRTRYHAYIVTLMKLAGDSPEEAEKTATDVMRIETALAHASMPRDEMRNPDNVYHPMPVSELSTLTPAFAWTQLFAAEKAPSFSRVNVAQPEFMKAMNTLIETEPLPALKNYMRFQTVSGSASHLSKPFDEAHFDFFGKVLNGQAQEEARWKRCTASADGALGEAVGQDWVRQNFPPAAKVSMEKLVSNLEAALSQDMETLPWMSDETRKEAKLKMSLFRQKIGYPDKWRDYSGIEVAKDDWFGDSHRAAIFNQAYDINHIGRMVDEGEWFMTPPTVNAYYDSSMNDINFPAGILQPPFYQLGIDPAVNYGGIGAVIGHEMTHGFDDEGAQFDGHGNKRNWFTPEDRAKFEARTACEVKEYNAFEPLPGEHENGKLTLGENTADNGGVRVAYLALQKVLAAEPKAESTKKIDGYSQNQRFFIAYAQNWCENVSPQLQRQYLKTDPHSPGEFRTNGVVQNFDEFGKAFNCHPGQPMMPVNSCQVW